MAIGNTLFNLIVSIILSLLGLKILTRPVNPTRTRQEISGFGFTLNGLGHKRVDPFTTRLSYLNGSCRGSPAGDPPDPFMFLFFF
jgi:hypothetical protein